MHLRSLRRNMPRLYQAMKAEVVAGQTITIGNSLLFAPWLLRETDRVPCAARLR
jgi:rhamnosyltransferase subunit B